jgi:hypothetical protein
VVIHINFADGKNTLDQRQISLLTAIGGAISLQLNGLELTCGV